MLCDSVEVNGVLFVVCKVLPLCNQEMSIFKCF